MIGPQLTGPTARLLGVGLELGAVIGGLTAVGYFADQAWDTGPYLALSGAVLGTSLGCYNAYRAINLAERRRKRSLQDRHTTRPPHDDDPKPRDPDAR